jgi:hypothetical protein
MIAGMTSCGRNDDEPSRTLFTIEAGEGYGIADSTYIILQNSERELIEYRQVKDGQTVTFNSSANIPGEKIDITIARIYPNSGGGQAFLWSYLDVPIGQSWTLSDDEVAYGPSRQTEDRGSYTISLNNVQSTYARSISDKYYLLPTQGLTAPLGIRAAIRSGGSRHLLSLDNGEQLKHQFIEDPKDGDSYTVDFTQMNDYDKIVEVSFSEPSLISCSVMGYETMEDFRYITGFVLYNSVPASPRRTSFKIGYLDGMAKYRTELLASAGKVALSYDARGAAPQNITLPSANSIRMTDKTALAVNYTSDVPVEYRVSYFISTGATSSSGTQWYFFGPEGRAKQPGFPAELYEKYPSLGTDKIRHYSTTFYVKTWPYEQFLERKFSGERRKAEEDEYEDISLILF